MMKNSFPAILCAALILGASALGVACWPNEATAASSYTTTTTSTNSLPALEIFPFVSLAPPVVLEIPAPPPVSVAPDTTVIRRSTTTYSSPAVIVAPPETVAAAGTVTRQTTTTYDSSTVPETITTETVRSAPGVTTTYEQKTYSEEDY
jgi:hypothetical protein